MAIYQKFRKGVGASNSLPHYRFRPFFCPLFHMPPCEYETIILGYIFCCILGTVGRQPPSANPFSKPLNLDRSQPAVKKGNWDSLKMKCPGFPDFGLCTGHGGRNFGPHSIAHCVLERRRKPNANVGVVTATLETLS